MKRGWKMHTRILLLCLGITLFALILQTILFQETSSEMIFQQAREESFHSMQNMQEDVYGLIKRVEKVLIESYNEREFIQDLKHRVPIEALREKYFREAYNLATGNFETQDGVVALYLYNGEHEIISTYRRAVTPRHNYPLDIYEQDQAYNAAAVKKYIESDDSAMLVSSYYNTAREKEIIRFVLKLYHNGNARNQIGYAVCDMDSKKLIEIMEKYVTNENMYLWFQPLGDRPAVSVGVLDPSEMKELHAFKDSIQAGGREDETTMESGGRVFFHLEQKKYNFGAYSLMPREMFYENQGILAKNLLLIAGSMFAVLLLVTWFVTKSLTRPLEQMTETARRIKQGNTKLRMEGLRNDETGILGQSFNEMLDTIEDLIGQKYRTKLLLDKAKYNALQAQINPHFLYNTLDTMGSIAQIQDCGQVSALCQSLSGIFRYSLDMNHPFSTLRKEIVHLKNYIYVMDVRMQDHVNYIFEVEEELLEAAIPRLTIQPIVENALNHGLRNSRRAKEVQIAARSVQEDMEITIKDNGVGMSEEKVRELEQNPSADNGTSIGIANIHMRLKMLYGEAYGLTVKSREGIGTSIVLKIPRKSEREVEHGEV